MPSPHEITNMLFVNPPIFDENLELTINGMKLYFANSTLVIGKKDPSYSTGKLFLLDNYSTIFNIVVLFDKADHQFKGLLKEFIELPFQYLYN